MQYRKKPVIINAFQFAKGYEAPQWFTDAANEGVIKIFAYADNTPYLTINTLEGMMKAEQGDYIIKGVKGELYPCKLDIFKMTYEEVHPLYKVPSGDLQP